MGLDIGVIAAEELLRALDGQSLHHVHALTSAVIALAGITLGVFVGQHRAHRHHNRLGYDVLGSDQLQIPSLPRALGLDRFAHFLVIAGNKVHYLIYHMSCPSFPLPL